MGFSVSILLLLLCIIFVLFVSYSAHVFVRVKYVL